MNDIPKMVLSKTLTKAGVPLFSGFTEPYVLDLIEAQAYRDGAVLHIYRPAAG
jgi:hypothetical protein